MANTKSSQSVPLGSKRCCINVQHVTITVVAPPLLAGTAVTACPFQVLFVQHIERREVINTWLEPDVGWPDR